VAAYGRWKARVVAVGAVLTSADDYVLGLAASREARLEELTLSLARCKDQGQRLRLVAAERLAAVDMGKALEVLERTYGAAAPAQEEQLKATGTTSWSGSGGSVVAFPAPSGLDVCAQRIVAAVRRNGPATKDQLRARVKGSQDDFLRGIKTALAMGALVKSGSGTKTQPYRYESGD
jgi:hypothetical protein